MMGATLPLLVRDGVKSEQQIGARIGALYAWNTAGAVCGALLTALLLLPQLGLRATQWSAAAVNLLVCAIALLLIPEGARPGGPARPAQSPVRFGISFWVLPLMALSGAVSFAHEVFWTRLLQRVVGSSVMAFGVMVASFLFGIALGGALGSRLARTRAGAANWWILTQVAIAAGAAWAWFALQAWVRSDGSFWSRAMLSGAVLLPLTIAIGVTYPLAVRVLAADVTDAPLASARVYAWNTTGAIAGALLGGFVLIPALRYEGTLALVSTLSLALALGGAVLLQQCSWRWWAALGALAAAAGVLWRPAVPARLLRESPVRALSGPILYYSVGRTADVVVTREARSLGLLSNGLPEAAIPLSGEPPAIGVESWMSLVAVLARPDIHNILIVGFGGGNAVAAVPPSVAAIDVIELEPQIVSANRAIAALRNRDPLADRRLNLVINDARGALALSDKHYDAILSQPSHPWTAGASHLYTREFLEQAKSHLRPGGVFVEWMGAEFLDPKLFQSLLATLHVVFPEVRLYRTAPTALLLLASDLPLEPERHLERLRAVLNGAALHYARLGLAEPENLVADLALDTAGVSQLAAGGALITDDKNRLATAGIQERQRGMSGAELSRLLAPFDPLTHAAGFVHREIGTQLAFNYIWHAAMLSSQTDPEVVVRLNGLTNVLGESDEGAYLRFEAAMRDQRPEQAAQALRTGLERWPQSALLRYGAVESRFDELSTSPISAELQQAIALLSDEPALVIRGVRLAAAQQWQELAQLDSALGAVRFTAPWGLAAAQLRVEWRARVANPELRQRYGDEALAIVDRAIAQAPTVVWYALRAMSAAGTNRPEVELESIASFTRLALENLPRSAPGDRSLIRERITTLGPMLQALAGDDRVATVRVAQVREQLELLRRGTE